MTEKELRQHIIPFLQYAKNKLEIAIKESRGIIFLCCSINDYRVMNNLDYEIEQYLKKRLWAAAPKNNPKSVYAWFSYKDNCKIPWTNIQHNKARLKWVNLQLKIVKV